MKREVRDKLNTDKRQLERARKWLRWTMYIAIALFLLIGINFMGLSRTGYEAPGWAVKLVLGLLMMYNLYAMPALFPHPGAAYLPQDLREREKLLRLWYFGAIGLAAAGFIALLAIPGYAGFFVFFPLYLPTVFYVLGCTMEVNRRKAQ